jgi:malonyl-CoA/methylmalonyl-CoA synthetase
MRITRIHEPIGVLDGPLAVQSSGARAGRSSGTRALTFDGRTLTYGELGAVAGAVAVEFAGVRRAAVWAEPSLEAVVAIVALVESGVEVVPLNPKLGLAELEHILSDSRPQVVVGAPDGVDLGGIERRAVVLEGEAELPTLVEDPERVALIIYTSGTTGRPKGVLMPARAIATNIDAVAAAWQWTAADSVAHALPIFHVHGLVLGTFGPLRLGGHAHHLGAFSPGSVSEALRNGDTMLFGVPTMYHRLAAAALDDPSIAESLRGARMLVSGSAGLPAKTFEQILASTGQRVVERYGLTETIMNTAVRFDAERRPGEVGPPLEGVDLRVLADGETIGEVPWDGETIGEVVVQGPNLFHGYLNRPDATAEALRDGWFWTGDLATRAPDGYVRIVGRKSTDLIKTGGFKVGAGEVEGALLEHPAVSEAAVRAEPDEDLGERIVAWVVLVDGATPPAPAQAPTRGPLRHGAAAQRDGQGRQAAARLTRVMNPWDERVA